MIIIKKEIARAIEAFLYDSMRVMKDTIEGAKACLVAEHYGQDWTDYEYGQYIAFNDIKTYDLMLALVNGYEVETIPSKELSLTGIIIKEVEQYSSETYKIWLKEKSGRVTEIKIDGASIWFQQLSMRSNILYGLREKLPIGTEVAIKGDVCNDNNNDIIAFSLITSSGFKLLDR